MKRTLLSALAASMICIGVQAQTQNPNNNGTATQDGTETGIEVSQETLNQNLAILWSKIQSLGNINTVIADIVARLDVIEMYQFDANGHEYVDLGTIVNGRLVFWATTNIGAELPADNGLYFAWGDTEGYSSYPRGEYDAKNDWYELPDGHSFGYDNYILGDGPDKVKKYCTDSKYGNVDNKTVLEPEDDAAHVLWKGSWRMPTDEELTALIEQCTWTWTSMTNSRGESINGYKVSNKSDSNKYIFLPCAGMWMAHKLAYEGSDGRYYSTACSSNNLHAHHLSIISDYPAIGSYARYLGCSIRPVCQ